MRLVAVVAVLLALAAPAAAQRAPDPGRGDELIDQFGLQVLRDLRAELSALALANPLTAEQYARIVELRRRHPVLARLAALDPVDHDAIAAALCGTTPESPCALQLSHALLCLGDRCPVDLPVEQPVDLVELPAKCTRYTSRRPSPALGLGIDWATGWQRSAHPTDGRAWSLGIATRVRLGRQIGAVARVDRIAGRDEAVDLDGNGTDDRSTGSITRITALAGPSITFDHGRFEELRRFLRLDVLAGYMSTRSQPDESGLAAGVDVGFQLWGIRIGGRVLQGFAGAENATLALVHLGFVTGSAPPDPEGSECEAIDRRGSRLAIGFDVPLAGYGVHSELGYLGTGIAAEAIWKVTRALDVVARADLMLFTLDERDRVIQQALLGGIRIDHGPRTGRRSRTGFFTTLMGGYSHHAGLSPSGVGSGPVVDAALGWGYQSSEAAGWFRLHGRIGVTPENVDNLVFFLSSGFELRFDRKRWRDRT